MSRLALISDSPVPSQRASTASGMAAARSMRIGDLAKATHKTQRALRLYEELGLLTPGERTGGGFRLYGVEAIERVNWIGKLQELGFTLPQIQGLVAAMHEERVPKEAMAQVRGLFVEKLDDVATQIARLTQLQRELRSSLSYLEACGGCNEHARDDAPGAVCCEGCTEHDATDHAPALLAETRRTFSIDGTPRFSERAAVVATTIAPTSDH